MNRVLASILMIVMLVFLLMPVASAELDEPSRMKSIPLWNADENWEWNNLGFEVDTKNQVEGNGCVSVRPASFLSTTNAFAFVHFPTVDATDMTALEFDFYISDVAALDMMKNGSLLGEVELMSPAVDGVGGEAGYPWYKLIPHMEKRCLVTGWNHVVIPLNLLISPSDNLDKTNIDCLRVAWRYTPGHTKECDEQLVLKFDHFQLTNRSGIPSYHTYIYAKHDESTHTLICCSTCGLQVNEAQPHTFSDWHTEHRGWLKGKERVRYCTACEYEQREKLTGLGCSSTLSSTATVAGAAILALAFLLKKRE